MDRIDRKLYVAITLIAVLSVLFGYGGVPVHAQEGSARIKISESKVLTIDGKDAAPPLMAGSSYMVDFTLEVAKGVSDIIILETDLELVGGQYQVYWELVGDYKGINKNTWTPARKQITFNSEEGKARFILRGTIPKDFVTSKLLPEGYVAPKATPTPAVTPTPKPGTKPAPEPIIGQVVHQKRSIVLVRLSNPSKTLTEEIQKEVIDKSIETYMATLEAKKKLLEAGKGDPKYVDLVSAIVEKAEDLARLGHTEPATALLNKIPDKGWPEAPSSNIILYGIAGFLGLLALLFFFLMVKSRSATAYAHQVADEQVKKLDIVGTRVGRLGDKALVQEINTIKEELERISGR